MKKLLNFKIFKLNSNQTKKIFLNRNILIHFSINHQNLVQF